MLHDLRTVLWKEWTEARRLGAGRLRSPFLYHAAVVGVGAYLASQPGLAFASSWRAVHVASVLAMMAAASVVADSFAGERERQTLETLLATRLSDGAILAGKVAAAALYGWTASLLLLAGGAATALLRQGSAFVSAPILAAAALVAGLAALGTAALGVSVSLRAPTVRAAQQAFVVLLMAAFLAPVAVTRLAPDAWRAAAAGWTAGWSGAAPVVAGAALLALLDAGALRLAAARFRRARLVGG